MECVLVVMECVPSYTLEKHCYKDVEKHLHLLICFFSRCRVENENHRWYRKGEENNMDLSNEFKETGV